MRLAGLSLANFELQPKDPISEMKWKVMKTPDVTLWLDTHMHMDTHNHLLHMQVYFHKGADNSQETRPKTDL